MAILLGLLAGLAQPALAQGIDPIGRIDPRAQPLGQVATLDVAALDRVAIEAEDVQRRNNGDPARFAIPFPVQATTAANGTWQNLDATWSLWRLRVRAPGASHINLGFTRCQLPPTAQLMVYSANYTDIVRPFTAADVSANGELWTPVVQGQELVVEVYVQTVQRPQVQVTVGQVGSGYRFFGAGSTAVPVPGTPEALSCEIDVACSQGAAWLSEISGVGAFSTGGSIFCTGSMLNNTAQDGRCFFLTAYHCQIRSGNAASLVVYWNYQHELCGAFGPANSSGFSTGSTWRAEYAATDFTLVELNTAPNPAWGVTYLGWEHICDCSTSPSSATIHHPNGGPKKISFDNSPTEIVSWQGTTSPGDGTHVRVVAWNEGTTEGGSSGAPLFSQNKRVVGQLHGGNGVCNGTSSFGRFAMSWTGGGTAGSRLSDWLDPGNTGATAVNTYGNANYSTFASGCAGSLGTSHLTATAPPSAGSSFQVTVDRLQSNLALMMTGFSSTTSQLGPLPLDLSSFGMPGCFGRVRPDLTSLLVGSNQQALWSALMPSGSAVLGFRFFQQALVLDPPAGTAAGWVISDATTGIISGAPGGIVGGVVPNMVTIAPGTFLMGSTDLAWWTEQPVHQVTISRPICVGRFEVKQAEFQAVMGTNPSYFQGANRPVEQVSWNDAMAYCVALTSRESAAGRLPSGYCYRLPTEAEWEYCCRAGTSTEFNMGSSMVCAQANFTAYPQNPCVDQTSVVGNYAANAWGLYDMHGNVWEWCLDSSSGNANYPATPVTDPLVVSGPNRIARGGSWHDFPNFCRSSMRASSALTGSARWLGFRVVIAPILP